MWESPFDEVSGLIQIAVSRTVYIHTVTWTENVRNHDGKRCMKCGVIYIVIENTEVCCTCYYCSVYIFIILCNKLKS
jgi:hypothetical protein